MITDLNTLNEFKIKILNARSLVSRLIGLLGTDSPLENIALHIQPCHGIHTFGMKYPIDVLFLDKNGCIIRILHKLQPNSVQKTVPGADSVLELAPGTAEKCFLNIGHYIQLQNGHEFKPGVVELRNLFHWPINLAIALFWCKFVLIASRFAIENPQAMNFGILIHNTLLMLFFLTRRKSCQTSFRFIDWMIPIITLIAAMLLRPVSQTILNINLTSAVFQYAGLTGIILSLLSLGRSFGIIPANRRIVSHGTYRVVRHPLYLSEIIFYTGFFMGNMSYKNCLLIILILAGQLFRSLSEERLLSADKDYQKYKQQVRFRFIPGIF
jgi:protein-S-isoprenylcysteine O-methyltransferase Ste14/uncharacterized membrane protein (UPF0127 family)